MELAFGTFDATLGAAESTTGRITTPRLCFVEMVVVAATCDEIETAAEEEMSVVGTVEVVEETEIVGKTAVAAAGLEWENDGTAVPVVVTTGTEVVLYLLFLSSII